MICRNRQGDNIEVYDNPTGIFHFLYDCAAGKCLNRALIAPGLSRCVGSLCNRRVSKVMIRPFIKKSGIDMSQYEAVRYKSYNDFFSRRIKSACRPADKTPNAVIAPCDCKLTIRPIEDNAAFQIKGIDYTFVDLVRDQELAEKYRGGTLVLCRLTVDDYHRYCYPASGSESDRRMLTGVLHTVNPFVAARVPLYKENNRAFSLLRTDHFGDILMMEIGAMLVGKIVNHPVKPSVDRGEEKGYFRFGGSSIILCFEKDRVVFDDDLLRNSGDGFETVIKMGERIGIAQ